MRISFLKYTEMFRTFIDVQDFFIFDVRIARIFSDYRRNHSFHDYDLKDEKNALRFEGDLLCDVRQRRTVFFS